MRHPLRWSLLFLVLSVPLAWRLVATRAEITRFATFNVALNRPREGALLQELRGGYSEQARQIAEIVQRVAPDVLLLCELDRDGADETVRVFAAEYLQVSQNGQRPIEYPFVYTAPVNTGEPTGIDVDGDGALGGAADAHGYGAFPGQYGMALLSRHPILRDRVRTFRELRWQTMPDALRWNGCPDAVWNVLRLSSKSHWDVPIGIGSQLVHVLCSHPTPPVFDGPEDRNGCRNHDEVRFWADYLTPERATWIVDDAGGRGGLAADVPFVLMGDLNCDPRDGDAKRAALQQLLTHPRVLDPEPRSARGGLAAIEQFGNNVTHTGDAELDTGDFPDAGDGPGNLRVDYVLVARSLPVVRARVFWPLAHEPGAALVQASDHRLVFVDVALH